MWAILIGLLALIFIILSVGSISALFLFLLEQAFSFLTGHDYLIFALPVLGLVTGVTYFYFGKKQNTPPLLEAFSIFSFTILSQLFGASTGRESSAVKMGAALSDFWHKFFTKHLNSTKISHAAFIRCGLAAGFGAVFGVPWAGTLFALESSAPTHRWSLRYLPLCWLASFGAHWTALAWGAHHKAYPPFVALDWNFLLIVKWISLGLVFGLCAKVFVILMQTLEKQIFDRIPPVWIRPAVGGLLIALLTLSMKDLRYNGLGVNLIDAAMDSSGVQTWDFAWKTIFTVVSSASGLKGGEITPLMAVGATLGATIAGWLSLPGLYTASLGLISVFASASHIPWTGAVMAWEIFGSAAFLPTFLICWVARRVVGLKPTPHL